ncbi:sugar ABC transporter permease [Paenibacillus sp. PAMC21692]|uniref:ABC transporter permease n=1 Tax=Paenibacillus sp. PAMC21692 TaxID=2762320 RepID=UPI0021C48093|nr:sugar ABC transporter permease [Paenibacillus sp. PAMC21692]
MEQHSPTASRSWASGAKGRLLRNRWLYMMVLPGLLYFLIFKYWPMYGIFISFKDYQPFLGFWDSPFVGFKHFERLFGDPNFLVLFRNTLILATYNILFFFPLPIIIALMLNELKQEFVKRTVQTLVYIPHFMSWVVVVGIAYMFFTTEGGIVNELIARFGGEKINFLISNDWFRFMVTAEVMWKETGWGTIIFLAALSGVDPQLYEAARMDGANRLRQMWHITLPAIRSTIVILLILRLGHFLDTGFEQIFLMLNAMNREVGEVFDTYVYSVGISQGQYSYSTAVGLFKSIVGLFLVVAANRLAKKFGEEGIY